MSPVLTRQLPIIDSSIRGLFLVNGGRWLLTVSCLGSVSYYDLDAQDPVKRTLITSQIKYLDEDLWLENFDDLMMTLDVDNESAILSFNLALYMRKYGVSSSFYSFNLDMIHMTSAPFKSKPKTMPRSSLACNP